MDLYRGPETPMAGMGRAPNSETGKDKSLILETGLQQLMSGSLSRTRDLTRAQIIIIQGILNNTMGRI